MIFQIIIIIIHEKNTKDWIHYFISLIHEGMFVLPKYRTLQLKTTRKPSVFFQAKSSLGIYIYGLQK